ncbi:hypothetical protein CORC01_12514 [Colletotrichum orchidophilum]|uniref:Uncharacterized protein n=1 Tax=Colletotrichum orchidophilum TaxID=1209926 RepID=A0A1G4ASN1_9PEZI|nr:uncharacterized protein CORC01_12514 [Colletotrichum orchidophilum]OHE92169.1 hypothetical protein CORC01_12514 [Colletotrichum orchidophilum]
MSTCDTRVSCPDPLLNRQLEKLGSCPTPSVVQTSLPRLTFGAYAVDGGNGSVAAETHGRNISRWPPYATFGGRETSSP